MGSHMGPSYANLFMGHLEDNLYRDFPYQPTHWMRYIDDIFLTWTHGLDKLSDFINHINTAHPSIKFTVNASTSNLPFLDLSLSINHETRYIDIDLYTKPTDSHLYLNAKSCHPTSCKKGIAYSLALRLKRICSNDTLFNDQVIKLKQQLVRRGYRSHIIDEAIRKVRSVDRKTALINNNKQLSKQRIPLNITYHPALNTISSLIRNNHTKYIKTDKDLLIKIPEPPLAAFRRNKNLKDLLVHSTLSPDTHSTQKCHTPRCLTCLIFVESDTFHSESTNTTYHIRQPLSCHTTHVIYIITCTRCNIQYVGETTTTLRTRMNNHRNHIKHSYDHPVARHFNAPSHTLNHLTVQPIEQVHSQDVAYLLQREKFWMQKLKTIAPHGLNIQT